MISVDPGINGAIIIWDGFDSFTIRDMPTMQVGSKRIVDYQQLANMIGCHDMVVVEKVGASPRGGTASMFNFGMSYGIILGAAAGCGAEVITVTPQMWKGYHGLLKKPKDAARLMAIKLYPQAKEELKLKKYVDRADAILIGDYYLKRGAI